MMHVFSRIGQPLSKTAQALVFVFSQIMIEGSLSVLEIGPQEKYVGGKVSTEFKLGDHDGFSGTIFHAEIEYADGSRTEMSFLAKYYEDWQFRMMKDGLVAKVEWESTPASTYGADWQN